MSIRCWFFPHEAGDEGAEYVSDYVVKFQCRFCKKWLIFHVLEGWTRKWDKEAKRFYQKKKD